jgi:hypothetical protein
MAEPSRERRAAARLLDALPDAELPLARAFLEFLHTRATRSDDREAPSLPFDEAALPASLRNAPIDDEPETPQERAAIEAAYAEISRGELVTEEELRRALGL